MAKSDTNKNKVEISEAEDSQRPNFLRIFQKESEINANTTTVFISVVVLLAYAIFYVFFQDYFHKELDLLIVLGHFTPIIATLLAVLYFYAYLYLEEKTWLYISLGWVVNALYLPLELFFRNPCMADTVKGVDGVKNCFEYKISVLLFSLISTFVFGLAALINSRQNKESFEKYHNWFDSVNKIIKYLLVPATIFNLLVIWFSAEISSYFLDDVSKPKAHHFASRFFISSLISSIFSAYVLFYLGYTFKESQIATNNNESTESFFIRHFPTSFYLYAFLQFFYPVNLYLSLHYKLLLALLFVLGMCFKVFNLVCLLHVLLRIRYPDYLNTQKQLNEINQLAQLGAISATIEHDLKTPIANMEVILSDLKKRASEDIKLGQKINISLEELEEQKNRINASATIIPFMRAKEDFYRKQEYMSKLSLQTTLDTAIKNLKKELKFDTQKYFFRHNLKGKDTNDKSSKDNNETKDFFIYAYSEMIVQILVNLFKNSYESINETGKTGGEVRITVAKVKKLPETILTKKILPFQNWVQIDVYDEGIGISNEIIDDITEIFTTKIDKPNGGVGLFIAKRLLSIHDAFIDFDRNVQVGAKVSLFFPENDVYKAFLDGKSKKNHDKNEDITLNN
jgi:signal transduction histidine kinase